MENYIYLHQIVPNFMVAKQKNFFSPRKLFVFLKSLRAMNSKLILPPVSFRKTWRLQGRKYEGWHAQSGLEMWLCSEHRECYVLFKDFYKFCHLFVVPIFFTTEILLVTRRIFRTFYDAENGFLWSAYLIWMRFSILSVVFMCLFKAVDHCTPIAKKASIVTKELSVGNALWFY